MNVIQASEALSSSAAVVNRNVRITPRPASEGVDWLVEAAVPGQGLRTSTVLAGSLPGVHEVFATVATGEGHGASIDEATALALFEMGVLVPAGLDTGRPRFAVRLDQPLAHVSEETARLQLNERVRFAEADDLDALERGRTLEVVDPVRGVELPYWLDGEQATTAAAVIDGRVDLHTLPERTILAFADAGIVHDPLQTAAARSTVEDAQRLARSAIVSEGYTIVHDLLPASYVSAVRHYFRALVGGGFLPFGDGQSARRYAMHSEALSVWLHDRVLPVVAPMLPVPVIPSYCYLVSYLGGAELPRHTDREQCAFTLSLAIDVDPDASRAEAWPLFLEAEGQEAATPVLLAPGDAVLFRGRQLTHFRKPLADGRTVTTLLLHFVEPSFDGALE